ncbi:MAG: fumarylacetoacetate hydrolase family protein [Pseudomonadota bacterium]
MQSRRVMADGSPRIEIAAGAGFVALADVLARADGLPSDASSWPHDMIGMLAAPDPVRARLVAIASELSAEVTPISPSQPLLPFAPRSFRDFMLYERHAVDAARGFARRFLPRIAPVARAYEAVTGRDFPAFRPRPLWYRQPIYYMGNHLAFVGDGAPIALPRYTRALDYELELGFVLARPLLDATPAVAEAAIGGFLVVNDFSARDVQLAEMRSGFGPQKAKHFVNAMSALVVSADEVLPRWRELRGWVRINNTLVAEPATAGPHWTLGEALAHVSRGERLHPGELFATGTLPGGSGIERGRLLEPGDTIEIGIHGIGSITNRIVDDGRGQS